MTIVFAPPIWLKLLVALLFVVPAGIAGYSLGHGLAHLLTHEPISVALISYISATAVSITSFMRLISHGLSVIRPNAMAPSV